tara:strand:- start:123 stop:1373 length:1251 start_codon:yes stop_codon:yes gene_type:complete
MLLQYNKSLLCLLFYFVPFSLIIGTFVTNLSVALICFIFLIIVLSEGRISYFFNKLFLFFLIWCLVLLISSIFSTDPIFSLSSSLFYFRFGLFSLAVWFIIENNKDALRYFTYSLLGAFTIVIIDGYIQYFLGENILGYTYVNGRLGGLFGDELILGSYLSRLYPLLLGLIFLNFLEKKRYLYFVFSLFIFIDILIYLSGERVAFLNLIISALLIILLIDKWKKIRLITLGLSLVIIVSISMSNDTVKNRMVDQTLNKIGIGSENTYIFSEEHQNFYISSIKMFSDRPLIGNGPKMYRKLCYEEKYFYVSKNTNLNTCSSHPHGTYPQLLAEAGLIGAIPAIFIFFWILYLFVSHLYLKMKKGYLKLSDYQICIIVSIFLTLWPLIPSGNFFGSWLSTIYYLPIGFLLHSFANNKS